MSCGKVRLGGFFHPVPHVFRLSVEASTQAGIPSSTLKDRFPISNRFPKSVQQIPILSK